MLRHLRSVRTLAVLATGLLALAAAAFVADRRGDDGAPAAGPAPATLAQYWAGEARWTLARKWTGTALGQPGSFDGAHIEVANGRWYLFNRVGKGGTCGGGELRMGIQVRESADRGATWSAPVAAIDPGQGTPWSCAATDGDAAFDPEQRVWHYLFQCKGESGGWQGCVVERSGDSPMGAFAPPAGVENPVIRSGELWGAICDPGDGCAGQNVREEGTFNVFAREGGDWWVSFHGHDGTRGYRGMARTRDFTRGSFEVDRPQDGLPGDAILDRGDADEFREQWAPGGPIGAGAGTIVQEDGRFYTLNEFPDVSLRCTNGQNWDLGLFRSSRTASTDWEPFPDGNPIVYSSRAPEADGQPGGCNVLYPSLFRDPDTRTWYLMHGRGTRDPAHNAIYLYALTTDASLLENGDFARADTTGWERLPGSEANLAAYRRPNESPDGTPYLAFNCGGDPCRAGESLHQDVEIDPALIGRAFRFGGTFRSESGSGSLELVVHQLDAQGQLLHSDKVAIDATGAYAPVEGTGTIQRGARALRYQLYPSTPQTFAADDLHLTPEPS